MASDRTIEFGSILERDRSRRWVWLVVIPLVAGVLGVLVLGLASLGRTDAVKRELAAAQAQAGGLRKELDAHEKLLEDARADESLLKTTGQAAALFYGAAPDAYESGLVLAHPEAHAAAVYLFGLRPPQGQAYEVAARARDGSLAPLGGVLPDDRGNGFLLSRKVPDGASAIELVLKPGGQEGLDGATVRVSARYPARASDRGILEVPLVQGRHGRR